MDTFAIHQNIIRLFYWKWNPMICGVPILKWGFYKKKPFTEKKLLHSISNGVKKLKASWVQERVGQELKHTSKLDLVLDLRVLVAGFLVLLLFMSCWTVIRRINMRYIYSAGQLLILCCLSKLNKTLLLLLVS